MVSDFGSDFKIVIFKVCAVTLGLLKGVRKQFVFVVSLPQISQINIEI